MYPFAGLSAWKGETSLHGDKWSKHSTPNIGIILEKETQGNKIFRMTQGTYESLEDFEERFQLSYRMAHNCTLDPNSLKLVLL